MIRTLICDDEKASQDIIQLFIEEENPMLEIVGTASNGIEALELIQKEKPDLVFMDIHMPCFSGMEVIEKSRATDPEVKFIIITAYESFEYARQALRLGAVDILPKPVDFDQLSEAITRAVGIHFTPSNLVNHILEYIHDNYNKEIHLPELAQLSFCTESHLAREFKKYTGGTILTYIHKIRIERAVTLLKEGNVGIQEAADQVGYQNINNFYKYFKQSTGMTPAAYLNDAKSKSESQKS